MKFSKQWIQSYISLPIDTAAIVDTLTMAGLEVDSVTPSAALLTEAVNTLTSSEADTLIEIDLTPNRGDCLSIQGIARELAVLTQQSFNPPKVASIKSVITDGIDISCEAPTYCPRYAGRVIKNINGGAMTPAWMVARLASCDIRAIHPVVDILNYVMLELGQPMHAFDLDRIQGGICVRLAQSGEKIKLLDGTDVTLQENTLVIADHRQAHAIAGIMGGLDSGVTEQTTDILLESALFLPTVQAGKARQYGLQTDSSYRFERGVDPNLQIDAIERATALILEVCGGNPGKVQEIVNADYLPRKQPIQLRIQRIQQMLGIAISHAEVQSLLTRMGCQCEPLLNHDAEVVKVTPPAHRYDINIEIDLIEELARIVGYQNIPAVLPVVAIQAPAENEAVIPELRMKQALVDMGYLEAIHYSFTDSGWQKILFPEEDPIALLNPISQDLDVMRTSLLPGLLKSLAYNLRRQQSRVMLFELGNVYHARYAPFKQSLKLGGICTGTQFMDTWRKEQRVFDFFDIKGHLSALWQLTRHSALTFEPSDHFLNQRGISAQIRCQDQSIGWVGKLDPTILKQLDMEGEFFWFECDAAPFLTKRIPKLVRPSRFPEIRRDIAIIVDNAITSASLIAYVSKLADDLVQDVCIFDEYKGKGIQPGRKSIALGLILQHPSRTLVDDEVNTLMQSIMDGLKKDFAAELRE